MNHAAIAAMGQALVRLELEVTQVEKACGESCAGLRREVSGAWRAFGELAKGYESAAQRELAARELAGRTGWTMAECLECVDLVRRVYAADLAANAKKG